MEPESAHAQVPFRVRIQLTGGPEVMAPGSDEIVYYCYENQRANYLENSPIGPERVALIPFARALSCEKPLAGRPFSFDER